MNVTDKIKFDSELIGNKSANITYNGYLYEIGSNEVSIVYGFDDDWKNTTEKTMTKTDDGFCASIPICNYSKIVFCFKNSEGIYDNNFNQNFSTSIKMRQKNKRFIINENYLLQIYHELRRDDMSKIIEEEIKEEKENIKIADASIEELHIEDVPSSDFNMDTFVDSLLSPIAEEKGVDKQDVYDFDVETLTEKYISEVNHEKESVVNTNDIIFNKIEIESPSEDDISEKKVLLSQINKLFDELVQEEENENVNKLYELSTGSTIEEDRDEVSRMINETEKAMDDINKLFLDIDYINSTKTETTPIEDVNTEKSPVQKAVPLNVENIISATAVAQDDNKASEEEKSLFNEYENTDDTNKTIVSSSYDDEITKLESETSTSDGQANNTEEDPGKYLLVQNNDSFVDRLKLPFTKLFKLIGLGLSKLFNKED